MQTPVCIFGLLPLQYLPPFAALKADGSVVTWGHPRQGGDSSIVQSQLQNVRQIFGAHCAFVAILQNGTLVTWGDPVRGGDCSRVQHQIRYI